MKIKVILENRRQSMEQYPCSLSKLIFKKRMLHEKLLDLLKKKQDDYVGINVIIFNFSKLK